MYSICEYGYDRRDLFVVLLSHRQRIDKEHNMTFDIEGVTSIQDRAQCVPWKSNS